MSKRIGLLIALFGMLVLFAGQMVGALGYKFLGPAIGLLGVGIIGLAKAPELTSGKLQHPFFVAGLMLASLLTMAVGQYLSSAGKTALGLPFTGLSAALGGYAKMGDALLGGDGGAPGPGGAAAGGAAA